MTAAQQLKKPRPLPAITSLGLPPEMQADRVVAEMLKVIVAARVKILPTIQAMLAEKLNDGAPHGQQKVFDRLLKAGGAFFIGGGIETGKRGKYQMRFLTLVGWDAEHRRTLETLEPKNAKRRLATWRS
jgi:hypothetical protein